MARPRIPDEIKMARGTFRPGRANPSVNGLCEHANRRLQVAKDLLGPEAYDVYAEAIHRIEFRTPHCDGQHGMPTIDGLADIEIVEAAVDELLRTIGADAEIRSVLSLRSSDLYHLILDQQARAI